MDQLRSGTRWVARRLYLRIYDGSNLRGSVNPAGIDAFWRTCAAGADLRRLFVDRQHVLALEFTLPPTTIKNRLTTTGSNLNTVIVSGTSWRAQSPTYDPLRTALTACGHRPSRSRGRRPSRKFEDGKASGRVIGQTDRYRTGCERATRTGAASHGALPTSSSITARSRRRKASGRVSLVTV